MHDPGEPETPPDVTSAGAASAGEGSAGEAWGTRKALEVLAVAFVLPLTLYVGYAAGRWVGEWLGEPAKGGLTGAALGALAGFWELHRLLRRLWPR